MQEKKEMAVKRVWVGIVAVVMALACGGSALAAYNLGRQAKPAGESTTLATIGTRPGAGAIQTGTAALGGQSTDAVAPAVGAAQAPGLMAPGYAYPCCGGGAFQPGLPPYFGQGGTGDGLSAWGVAYRETAGATSEPGADLIHAAYQDAQKRAQTLAGASGQSLGKVLAVSDHTQVQPWYKPCLSPAPGAGITPGAGSTGSGVASGAPGAVSSQGMAVKGILPPQPACAPTYYQVAWVSVRYAIG
ncbi:MAG TPA: SIMPL domain-containing protein [Candidatus Dormibacteraeota bacterium]|nr:SIMPL domain-containing protein [Candidatus Dormibacteraeota bacterium]